MTLPQVFTRTVARSLRIQIIVAASTPTRCVALACLLALLMLPHSGASQSPSAVLVRATAADTPRNIHPLRSKVELVQLAVTVTDPYDRMVVGLQREHFKIFEDKVQQEISHFMTQDLPVSIGIVLDLSGSMADKSTYVQNALREFVRGANPQDEYFLVLVADQARLVHPFTRDPENFGLALMHEQVKGRTALLDGVYLGMTYLQKARYERRALLVVSDGADNHSRFNERDVQRAVKESDVQIHTIGVFGDLGAPGVRMEEVWGPELLADLAENSGGRTFEVHDMRQLNNVAANISLALRNQYTIGYQSSNKKSDGKWRKVKVQLKPPKGIGGLRAFARRGYFAPSM